MKLAKFVVANPWLHGCSIAVTAEDHPGGVGTKEEQKAVNSVGPPIEQMTRFSSPNRNQANLLKQSGFWLVDMGNLIALW